jgi:hypothetical protein
VDTQPAGSEEIGIPPIVTSTTATAATPAGGSVPASTARWTAPSLVRSSVTVSEARAGEPRGCAEVLYVWVADEYLLRQQGHGRQQKAPARGPRILKQTAKLPLVMRRTHSCVPRRDSSRRRPWVAKTLARHRPECRCGTQECMRHESPDCRSVRHSAETPTALTLIRYYEHQTNGLSSFSESFTSEQDD